MTRQEMNELVRKGAAVELAELKKRMGTLTRLMEIGPRPERRKMSAAARKRISLAQRARWAKMKKAPDAKKAKGA